MKLANRAYLLTLILLTLVFAVSAQNSTSRSENEPRNSAPTVGTGGPAGGPTGLFTVYDGWTLRRGEYTLSIAYSNYDRDPGNVDITSVPISFQVGLSNRFELFFTTEGWRGVKVNTPRNLSGFYLPNSTVLIGGVRTSAPAIILAPSGPGNGPLEGRAIYRPTGTQPFTQFPYVGGFSGNFGLGAPPFFSGPQFGFPAGTQATMGPPTAGNAAANFPGIGSTVGGLLPGIVLSTVNLGGQCAGSTAAGCQGPAVFTIAPSYLPEMPFLNRTWGTSSFNHLDFGFKWRFNDSLEAIGYGVVAYYRWWMDTGSDFAGFNQMQRGAGPGGNRGDIHVSFFADARLATWVNMSGNVGYTYTADSKGEFPGGEFTMLDRPDEVNAGIALDFPVNKHFQPILELRGTRYVGGRTPNAFERHPLDGIGGVRIFPRRWFGFGFAYRYNFNQQDADSFDDATRTASVTVPCLPGVTAGCPRVITTTFSGVPNGFTPSSDPHGYIGQFWIGRRDARQGPIENKPPSVDSVTLSDTTITLPCPPGMVPRSGTGCSDSRSITVATRASDPENDVLTYNYTVSGGRIVGTGANVTWDLAGATPGTYTITTGVDDGCGVCGKTDTQTITVENCDCIPASIPCSCPTLSVSGPAGITEGGDSMTFTANASGGSQTEALTYNWSVTSGTITSGQGTPSITVATTRDMRNTTVTATVTIGGAPDCQCPTTASANGDVGGPRPAEQIDEYGKLSNDDVKARIDALFIRLANEPTAQGYIIIYGTPAQIRTMRRQITSAIAFRRHPADRVTIIEGPDDGSGGRVKLYIVPAGAENPQP